MRGSPVRRVVEAAGVLSGAALIFVAVFAFALGLDHNPQWGAPRTLLAMAGCFMLLWAAGSHFRKPLGKACGRLQQNLTGWLVRVAESWAAQVVRAFFHTVSASQVGVLARRLARGCQSLPVVRFFAASRTRRAWAAAAVIILLVLSSYVWFISLGRITDWGTSSTYYDKLGEAFLHGQNHLLLLPDPGLALLANPYDRHNREGLAVLWDATYFNGKYYLYWGPTPALFLALAKLAHPGEIPDLYLTAGFTAGMFLFECLLLVMLWRRFFPRLGARVLLPPLLVAGLGNPMVWLLSRPGVYEAAVAGDQFFLLGGIFWALTGLDGRRPVTWRLGLAGIFWALSVGARTTMAPAVVVMAFLAGWRILRMTKTAGEPLTGAAPVLAALLLPLAAGAAAYGWYNWQRFGSPLEFGHRFQLTGEGVPPDYRNITSPGYVLPNLYNYLLRPPVFSAAFPFVSAPWIRETMWPFFIRLPKFYYYPEPIAGLLTTLPYGLLALGGFWQVGRKLLTLLPRREAAPAVPGEPAVKKDAFLQWVLVFFSAAFLAEFIPMTVFNATVMRYLADFVPTLLLLAALGFWLGLERWRRQPLKSALFVALVLALAAYSVGVGVLLGLSDYAHRFESQNASLYYRMVVWFNTLAGQ